jgi:hypothetical protein
MLNAFVVNPKKETDVISTHVPSATRNPRPPPIPITCDLTDSFPFATQPPQHHLLVYPSSYHFYSHCVSLTIDYSVILCIFHSVHTLRPASPPFGCVHSFFRFRHFCDCQRLQYYKWGFALLVWVRVVGTTMM